MYIYVISFENINGKYYYRAFIRIYSQTELNSLSDII